MNGKRATAAFDSIKSGGNSPNGALDTSIQPQLLESKWGPGPGHRPVSRQGHLSVHSSARSQNSQEHSREMSRGLAALGARRGRLPGQDMYELGSHDGGDGSHNQMDGSGLLGMPG